MPSSGDHISDGELKMGEENSCFGNRDNELMRSLSQSLSHSLSLFIDATRLRALLAYLIARLAALA